MAMEFGQGQELTYPIRLRIVWLFCISFSVILLMDYSRLMTILDHRFPDSLQRLDNFIQNRTKKKIDFKKTWLAFLIGLMVLIGISYFLGKVVSSLIFMAELILISFLLAKFQSWMLTLNRKMLDDLKQKLETEIN